MYRTFAFAAAISGIALGSALAQATAPANPPAAAPAAPATTNAMPRTAGTTEVGGPLLGTQVWKQAVYDGKENRIGEIDNLVIGKDGKISDALIGVGGFLGLGEKTVAIPFSDLKAVKRDGNLWFVTAMTKEQLTAAPAYDTKRFEVK